MRAALLVALCLFVSVLQAGERFVPGFESLPLMAGLEVEPGSAVAFDKPGGRLVEAAARGALPPTRILDWYGAALPQLGWRPEGPGRFSREGETLSLTVTADGDGARIAFRLHPR